MESNRNNLENKLEVDDIRLEKTIRSFDVRNIVQISQELYDQMKFKDPFTIYKITDNEKMYYGELWITDGKDIGQPYYLTINDNGEYEIYFYNRSLYTNSFMERICIYNDPDTALEHLRLFNKVGSHSDLDIAMYNMIGCYFDGDITINDLIEGIIAKRGFDKSPEFQDLISTTRSFGGYNELFMDEIANLSTLHPDSLFSIYKDLLDVFTVKYSKEEYKKYFREHGTERGDININNFLNDCRKVFNKHFPIRYI